MDQEELKCPELGKALGICFKLEILDIGGCSYLSDEFISQLCSGESKDENDMVIRPGLTNLNTVKLNFLQ